MLMKITCKMTEGEEKVTEPLFLKNSFSNKNFKQTLPVVADPSGTLIRNNEIV